MVAHNKNEEEDVVVIEWTHLKILRFKILLESLDETVEEFQFEGSTFDKGYAKYLLEYLQSRFGECD